MLRRGEGEKDKIERWKDKKEEQIDKIDDENQTGEEVREMLLVVKDKTKKEKIDKIDDKNQTGEEVREMQLVH